MIHWNNRGERFAGWDVRFALLSARRFLEASPGDCIAETVVSAWTNDDDQAIRFALIRRALIVVRFISNEGDVGIFAARPDAYPVEADWERTR